MGIQGEFYEDDEPVDEIRARFAAGEKLRTGRGNRHRGRWHWGSARDLLTRQERRSDDDVRPPRPRRLRRKDTRRWCRGVEGREHEPEIVIPENQRWRWNTCRPAQEWMRADWSCAHSERCRVCGRVLRDGWQLNHPEECPDHPDYQAAAAR